MAFTKVGPTGAIAAKGRWSTLMQATMGARVRMEAVKRAPGAVRGAQGVANKARLAAALAGIPAHHAPRNGAQKAAPASSAANRARLDAALSDD